MSRCPEDRGVLGTRDSRFLPLHLTLGAEFGESVLSFISALRNNTLLRNVASFSDPLPPFSFFLAELEKCIQEQERLAQLFIKHVSVSCASPSPLPLASFMCVLKFLLSSALPSHPSLSCCFLTFLAVWTMGSCCYIYSSILDVLLPRWSPKMWTISLPFSLCVDKHRTPRV